MGFDVEFPQKQADDLMEKVIRFSEKLADSAGFIDVTQASELLDGDVVNTIVILKKGYEDAANRVKQVEEFIRGEDNEDLMEQLLIERLAAHRVKTELRDTINELEDTIKELEESCRVKDDDYSYLESKVDDLEDEMSAQETSYEESIGKLEAEIASLQETLGAENE